MGRIATLLVLAAGCASKVQVAPRTESPAEPVAAAASFHVRATPPEQFADPQRRSKIVNKLSAIREAVATIVAADRLVGVAVGIVVDGELVLGEGFGARHTSAGGAIDTRTAFRIGSITKLFTAMTALQLAEAGRLDLDAPASEVLPELGRLTYPAADARRLTVRDILTHSAGLARNPDLPPLQVDDAATREQLMQAIDGMSLIRAPGLAHEYSNLGFALLGHIVAAASGRPYHDAIRGALLEPLGMRATVWERSGVASDRLAIGHAVKDGRVEVVPPTRHGDIDAAGGLFSTVEDLARFAAFQLAAWPARGDPDPGPLTRATLRGAQSLRGGLTWRVSQGCDQVHVVGHSGAVDGYHATLRILPNAGIGVIVLANAGWADTGHIADEIQRVLARDGGLALRTPQALPVLTTTAAQFTRLLSAWDDASFAALATLAWRDDDAIARLGERVRWLHDQLGACTLGPLRRPTSAWSGVFGLVCERGVGELGLGLTSAAVEKIARVELSWTDGTPAPPVQAAATAAVALLEQFATARFHELFAPTVRHTSFERLAKTTRGELGSCRLGLAVAVDGPEDATFALTCDRGAARMTLALDRGQPARIAAFQVIVDPKPPCR
jgi:CubicO group peptidase (beta-lactamase class C family)